MWVCQGHRCHKKSVSLEFFNSLHVTLVAWLAGYQPRPFFRTSTLPRKMKTPLVTCIGVYNMWRQAHKAIMSRHATRNPGCSNNMHVVLILLYFHLALHALLMPQPLTSGRTRCPHCGSPLLQAEPGKRKNFHLRDPMPACWPKIILFL